MLQNEKLQQSLQFQTQLTNPLPTLNSDNEQVFIMKMLLNLEVKKVCMEKIIKQYKVFLLL